MCGAESPRGANVGEASLHLPVGCLDGPGWPAPATKVTSDTGVKVRLAAAARALAYRRSERHKELRRKWREAHREEQREYARAWRAANPDKVKRHYANRPRKTDRRVREVAP